MGGHVARIKMIRNSYGILVGKSKGRNNPLGKYVVDRRIIQKLLWIKEAIKITPP
jgi:hypothetical protein